MVKWGVQLMVETSLGGSGGADESWRFELDRVKGYTRGVEGIGARDWVKEKGKGAVEHEAEGAVVGVGGEAVVGLTK